MGGDFCKAQRKVSKIKYHFVFCIKYRKDLFLIEKYVKMIKKICQDIEKRHILKFETIRFDKGHVHFMIRSLPNDSPSTIFQVIKSISAKELFRRHPDLKKELGEVHLIKFLLVFLFKD